MRILQKAGVLLFGVVTMYLILRAVGLSGWIRLNQNRTNQDTVYFVAVDEVYGINYVPVEEYVLWCMAEYWINIITGDNRYAEVIEDLQDETLKAMSVVIRTQLIGEAERTGRNRFGNRKFFWADAQKIREQWGYRGDVVSSKIMSERAPSLDSTFWQRMEEAIADTYGRVLLTDREVSGVTFHMMSNGRTRENGAVYPWAVSTDCPGDRDQELSVTRVYYTRRELEKMGITGIEEKSPQVMQDSCGYVDRVIWGDMVFSGEGLAERLELPSSAYLIMPDEEGFTFIVTGMGHGYGMSVMEADQMAQDGEEFHQILSFFYELLDCKKIE